MPINLPTYMNDKVYSLIAQRDNAINLQIAEASKRIAEDSRQDNIAMRQIALDSKTVALATARDSAAMRVIAAVTIFFLPATFTAVSFLVLINLRGLTTTNCRQSDIVQHQFLRFPPSRPFESCLRLGLAILRHYTYFDLANTRSLVYGSRPNEKQIARLWPWRLHI